ncbi:hypothetical protein [Variovorax sp. GT1P44]|uniref:hypothetical protein n=1 Tax=Variovorax sp. GT1P44 TaxID=3443742 RepID=UPI003F456843
MSFFLIHAVRWGSDGTPTELRWAKCSLDMRGLHQGELVEVNVQDAVDAIQRGDKVQVFVGGRVGSIVRLLVNEGGKETIQDIKGVREPSRLANLPTF